MTKKQFEQQLKEQAYTAVPDKREDLLKTVAAQDAAVVSLSDSEDEPHLVPVVPARSPQNVKRWLALAACFMIVLVAVFAAARTEQSAPEKKAVPTGGETTTTSGFGGVVTVPATQNGPTGASNTTTGTARDRANGGTTATGSVSGGTTATGSVSGGTTATGSVSGGTNVTQTASGSTSGGTNATGPVSSGTTQKSATTSKISKKTKNPFWGDFSVSTTKKKDSGATTEKTEAPSAKPTTKRTTAPTCSHEVFYRPPLPADVRNNSDKIDTCVKYLEWIEPTEPWEPVAPTAAPPTTKKQSTPSTYSEGGVEFKGCYPNSGGVYYVDYAIAGATDVRYRVRTDVYFADGWRTLFISQCTENEILYTEVIKYADNGVRVYEEKYNERSEIMTITCRDRNGNVISSATRNIPLKSWEFSEMYAY